MTFRTKEQWQLHEDQVFMIAQALVASGKHTNPYELAREAVEISRAVKNDFVRYQREWYEEKEKEKSEPAE
jgi:hypothetical protein